MEKAMIEELTQGRELANQLKNQLESPESIESCEFLLQKLSASYEKALSMLTLNALPEESAPEGSHSGDENRPHRVSKKRKNKCERNEEIKVNMGGDIEGNLDDGHSWRKYGQKVILGANHPRSYYRCTHRGSQNCLATKKVQRSDKKPSVFEVSYRGTHTCKQSTVPLPTEEKTSKKMKTLPENTIKESVDHQFQFETSLEVDNWAFGNRDEIFPLFSLSSTTDEARNVEFHYFFENSSSPFISPATSDLTNIKSNMADIDFLLDQVDFDPNFSLDFPV